MIVDEACGCSGARESTSSTASPPKLPVDGGVQPRVLGRQDLGPLIESIQPYSPYWCGNSPPSTLDQGGRIESGGRRGAHDGARELEADSEIDALLIPGLGPIPLSGDPTQAVRRARSSRTAGRCSCIGSTGPVQFAKTGAEGVPPPGPAGTVMLPSLALGLRPGEVCGALGAPLGAFYTRLSYRTESCCISSAFYRQWIAEREQGVTTGVVSGTSDALDALWPDFDRRWTSEHGAPGGLIDCWALPLDYGATDGLFFRSGRGAPYQTVLHALRLVNHYGWSIRDTSASGNLCVAEGGQDTGQAVFSMGMVQGLAMDHPMTSGKPCFLRVGVGDNDDDIGVTRVTTVCPDSVNREKERSCSSRVRSTGYRIELEKWDSFVLELSLDQGYPIWVANPSRPGGVGPVWGSWKGYSSDRGLVLLAPAWVSYCGQVVDDLLYKAHLALDYAAYVGDADVEATARRFAGYALRVVAEVGEVLIHELGHKWSGSKHCDGEHKCCFDKAGQRWLCRCIAAQGLPHSVFRPIVPTDFPSGSVSFLGDSQCGDAYYGTSCTIADVGEAGSKWSFCNAGCGEAVSSEDPCNG